MKQIIQSFKTGETILEEIAAPQVRRGTVLIQTTRTLVSLGTERMLVEFGKANLISKARQQPEKVKQVLDKIKTEGLMPTLEAVFNKLGTPIPLGYCNVGKVIAVGDDVSEFKIGERVASNGHHAEYVCVPKNLVAHIPENVTDEEAAFTVIGAIGLQGIRLLKPELGETVVVIGMGLIGLISAQLLIANGCRVIGVDIDNDKLELCKKWGVIPFNPQSGDVIKFVESQTVQGADGVIITASAQTNEIMSQAAKMSRKRGRIILVGVVGLQLSRSEFYEKELSFQVSCSYGPGRYDENYEQLGIDYPLPFVRWTEKRNFEAVLQSIASGRLKVKDLISEVIPIGEYQKIYSNIGSRHSIASILKYDSPENEFPKHTIRISSKEFRGRQGVVGIIGAGNFTRMTMLPALKKSGAALKYIASASGVSGTTLAKKYDFTHSTTDYEEILKDPEVDLVMITTRHNSHAKIAAQTLENNKHVFVEKPLALNNTELEEILAVYERKNTTLTVGFNRRFAPLAQKMRQLLGDSNAPINIIATMNAGFIPGDSWVHDPKIGGGRIIGEACHYMDLCVFLSGSLIKRVCMNAMGENAKENTDNASILLQMENGTNAVVNYFANGSKAYSKERVEVYSADRTLVMDNWRKLKGYGFKGFRSAGSSQNKGHAEQFRRLYESVRTGGEAIVPIEQIINVTRSSFAAIESLKTGDWINV